MLATQIEVSDGTLSIINVGIKFFEQDDISVSLDQSDAPLVLGVDYVWSNATTIQFLSTANLPGGLVPTGVEVIIRRDTKNDYMYNILDGGAPFSRLTLDENYKQLLYLTQEFSEGLGLDGLRNNLNMNGYRVTNVGPPTSILDATNKGYVDNLHSVGGSYTEQLNRKTLRTPEELSVLPAANLRANRLLAFDATGAPTTAVPSSGSAAELALALADPAEGASLVARSTVTIDSLYDVPSTAFRTDTDYMVRAWHRGILGGGGLFRYDANTPRNLHNGGSVISPTVPTVDVQPGLSITERASSYLLGTGDTFPGGMGCLIRVDHELEPEHFGALSGVVTQTVTVVGDQCTLLSGEYNASDIGKKIQIYRAGSSGASHASFIASVLGATATLRTPAPTSVVAAQAHMGFCSYFQMVAMVRALRNAGGGLSKASGTYLFASNNGNILLGQQVNLDADNTVYDFTGATFFGMLPVVRLTSGVVYSVVNVDVFGFKMVLLGDGLDALAGNSNWNAVAIAAQNSTVHSFSAVVGGGCRGISVQTSSASAPIKDVEVHSFTLIADSVTGATCDAIDVSMGLADLIDGVTIRDGKTYNFGKVIGVTNALTTYENKNVQIRNIEAFGTARKFGNINRTKGFLLDNVIVHAFSEEGLIINSCREGDLLGVRGICTGAAAAGINIVDSRAVPLSDSSIRVLHAKFSSTGAKYSLATIVSRAHGVRVMVSDIEDGVYGVYDDGYSGLFSTCRFHGNDAAIRFVVGSNLEFADCVQMTGVTRPVFLEESPSGVLATVVFNGTGADGTPMTIYSGHNVVAVTRVSVGVYDVVYKRKPSKIPSLAGCGRPFGGNASQATYGSAPVANAASLRVTLLSMTTGVAVASDYISLTIA